MSRQDAKISSMERGLRELEEEVNMLKSNGALSSEEREEEIKQMEVYRSHSKFMKNKVTHPHTHTLTDVLLVSPLLFFKCVWRDCRIFTHWEISRLQEQNGLLQELIKPNQHFCHVGRDETVGNCFFSVCLFELFVFVSGGFCRRE